MKVWLDALTGKQILLAKCIADELERRGAKTIITTRKFKGTLEMAEYVGLKNPIVIGDYGRTLQEKLRKSLERSLKLIDVISDFDPDLCISHFSPDAGRVTIGLGVKHICTHDTPQVHYIIRMSGMIVEKIMIPKIMTSKSYFPVSYKVVKLRGPFSAIWMKKFKPSRKELEEKGLDLDKPIVTIRTHEVYASYSTHRSFDSDFMIPLVKKLIKRFPEYQFVILPRYSGQERIYEKVSNKLIVVKDFIYAPNLLSFSKLLICGGGSMIEEAAFLGVPSISVYPGKYEITEFLVRKKAAFKASSVEEAYKLSCEILSKPENMKDEWGAHVREMLWRIFDDPLPQIADEAFKTIES